MAGTNNPTDESVERAELTPRSGKFGGERLPRAIGAPMKGRSARYVSRGDSSTIVGSRLPNMKGMKKGGETRGKDVRPSRGMGDMKASKMPKSKVGLAKGGKAKNFIQKAIKKPGALRAELGAKKGEPIPAGKLKKAAKAKGKLGQRARFAMTLKGMNKGK